MTKNMIVVMIVALTTALAGCKSEYSKEKLSASEKSFWGDSVVVLIAKEPQNGYDISIINNKELCLIHFERGDTISRYCALHKLPDGLEDYEDSIGTFKVELNLPVLEIDTLINPIYNIGMFFMDINFDGEEDFIVEHHGYNRMYYACFDLVNGNYNGSCPGLLESLNEEPYHNIVSSSYNTCYTVFDRKKKEIYTHETFGANTIYETWSKCFESSNGGSAIKLVKTEKRELFGDCEELGIDAYEHIITFILENDTLKKVRDENVKLKDASF